MGNFELIWWVLALPVIGFLIQSLLGQRIVGLFGQTYGKKVAGALAVLPIAAAFVLGAGLTLTLLDMPATSRSVVMTLFDWITVYSISIPFEVVIDPLSMTMVLVVTGIGSLIHLYATGY
ncbi:MAG: NADH-quinone oxidoreductase subunit L, partial [Fimbriimonadaceae bacterium]|nr:NADH-quinone oxidoreductase subunit L [Fimbriimonadaceae bacterium]